MPWEHGDCQQAHYSLNDDGTLKVYNTEFNAKEGKVTGQEGKATCNGPACKVSFFEGAPAGDYRVLATDYTNFSVVYSCTEILGLGKSEFIWLLTRAQDLNEEIQGRARAVLGEKIPEYVLEDNVYRTQQGGSCQYLQ